MMALGKKRERTVRWLSEAVNGRGCRKGGGDGSISGGNAQGRRSQFENDQAARSRWLKKKSRGRGDDMEYKRFPSVKRLAEFRKRKKGGRCVKERPLAYSSPREKGRRTIRKRFCHPKKGLILRKQESSICRGGKT